MVRSYDDPLKRQAREKLRHFIARKLAFKKPSDIKVVCFPGAEVEGEEALEVKEIYDPLGIPRKNVVGLEKEQDQFKRLKRANLGIILTEAPMSDLDFFTSTPDKFDVISLDYQGHQDESETKTLEQIAGRQVLSKYGILCTNYAGQRETRRLQSNMLIGFTSGAFLGHGKGMGFSGFSVDEVVNFWKQKYESNEDFELSQLRNAITFETLSTFLKGTENVSTPKLFQKHPYYEQLRELIMTLPFDQLRSAIIGSGVIEPEDYGTIERFDVPKRLLVDSGILTSAEYEERVKGIDDVRREMFNHIVQIVAIRKHIAESLGLKKRERGLADFIGYVLNMQGVKSYFPRSIERYSYTSNKNMLMLLDLVAFDQNENAYREFGELISYGPQTGKISFRDQAKKDSLMVRKRILGITRKFIALTSQAVPERIYLGSSWVPPPRKERISKEEAVYLLSGGVPCAEIADTYAPFTVGQLAAFRAHITMGTYKDKTPPPNS